MFEKTHGLAGDDINLDILFLNFLTSIPAASDSIARRYSSASFSVIHPAAANLSFAASQDSAYEYSFDNGSGE